VQAGDVPIVLHQLHTGAKTELSLEESATVRACYPSLDHAARKYRAMIGPGRLIVIDETIVDEILSGRLGWTPGDDR
jgi:hypothetical protein